MIRRAKKKTSQFQIYRHFAVVTVAATLVLAIFADGDKRQAAASDLRLQNEANPAATERAVRMTAGLLDKRSSTIGTFDSGFDSGLGDDFGEPMDAVGATPEDVSFDTGDASAATIDGSATLPGGVNRYGISTEEWEQMSQEQRREIVVRYNVEHRAEGTEQRQQEIAELLARSSDRSGN